MLDTSDEPADSGRCRLWQNHCGSTGDVYVYHEPSSGCIHSTTEVLAKQHYESILSWLTSITCPLKPVLLTGSLTAKQKRRAKESIVLGTGNVIIGTQALLQDDVDFYDLRLVITDEQHRFGVKQRETFAQKEYSRTFL